ncbi:TerD family protein [Streptomyces sp900105245]|uniref:TerD family protein n=1 Tax=Streptomyces sp. 900105245 TaxID=3154379 RepID=A0ABV1UHM1_9ACTN
MERATQLERERNEANQMVLVLLAMVDKLHRDIAALGRERDRIRSSSSLHTELHKVHERLTRSEQQRATAESELERAHAERHKADQLAEEAAEQVRVLTAELERLRGAVPTPDASNSAQMPATALDLQGAADQSADDMDMALLKAARHLDDSADRLDQLATELHLDNQSDNPAASNDVSDNPLDIREHASEADAAIGAHSVLMDTLITLARDQGHGDESAAEALREEDLFSTVRERAARGGYEMEEVASILNQVRTNRTLSTYDALYASAVLKTIGMVVQADQLLADVVDTVEAAELPALTKKLRASGRAAELYRVLSGVAQTWNAPHIVAAVTGLRSHGQPADAYQMLSAVARDSPPDQVLNVTQQLTEDTNWILDVACRDRPVPELLALAGAFQALRPDLALALERAHRGRRESSTSPTAYEAGTQERISEHLVPPTTFGDIVAIRRDLLPLDTVVQTSARAMKVAHDGRQHALYRLCAKPHSIGQIARYRFMSIFEAQVLVTDLVEAGLLREQREPLRSQVLESGDLVDLPTDVAAGTLSFGLGWEASNSDLVPDASALALVGDSASNDHFIFYNHLKAPDLSIVHLGAASGTGDQASILVNVLMLPTNVTRVIFTLSIYDSDPPKRSLGSVEHPYIRIAAAGGREIGRHELSPPSASDTAVVCGVLEKHVGGWTFIAGGRGYTEGLREVALDHGLAVTGGDVRSRNRLSDIFRRVPRLPRT